MLDQAFVAAAAAVAVTRGKRATEPADVEELRALVEQLPEFRELVGTVVEEAERWAHAGAAELWTFFGLTTDGPGWNEAEQSGARLLVARACAPLEADGVEWLRARHAATGGRALGGTAHRRAVPTRRGRCGGGCSASATT